MEKLFAAKKRLGVDCGSDHQLLIAKCRLKLKKVGKTTRSFRYDLNQISYDYAVQFSSVHFSSVAQLCPSLCDPMNCSMPGSSVHGILQARILEWVAISFSIDQK